MLEPCKPLERTLEAVRQLSAGDYLYVRHRREPHLLYSLLEKGGFAWHCVEEHPDQYAIYIWRESDQLAGEEATSHFSKQVDL